MNDPNPDPDRRTAIKAVAFGLAGAAGVTAVAGAAPAPDAGAALETAFRAAFATPADKPGNMPADRLAFLADPALVIDSDVPFPLDRAGYADHLAFHAANWTRLELRFHDLRTAIHGSTGIVSAYFVQRGKPAGSGFRLRAGYCTAVCALDARQWRAIALHFGALSGQISDASPS